MVATDMPDFENMSPEEMLHWMETQAQQQAEPDESLFSEADATVAQVAPTDVATDEPSSIPREQTTPHASVTSVLDELTAEHDGQNVFSFLSVEPEAINHATPTPALSHGAPSILDELDLAEVGLPDLFNQLANHESTDLSWMDALSTVNTGNPILSLDDLDALTADLDDNLFNLTFNPPAPTQLPPPPTTVLDALEQFDQSAVPSSNFEVVNPLEDSTDPLTWLENIARRHGVPEEELITKTRFDVPVPTNVDAQQFEPGYVAYSVDEEGMEGAPIDPIDPDSEWLQDASDPSAWFSDSDAIARATHQEEEEEASGTPEMPTWVQATEPTAEASVRANIDPAVDDAMLTSHPTSSLEPEPWTELASQLTLPLAESEEEVLEHEHQTDLLTPPHEPQHHDDETPLTLFEPAFPAETTLNLADYDEGLPHWFKPQGADVDLSVPQDDPAAPEWQTDALDLGEAHLFAYEEPMHEIADPQPEVVTDATPAQSVFPAPQPVVFTVADDIEQALQQAQQYQEQGEVASALLTYETVIRSNQALDEVVNAVQAIIASNESNITALRVLGDALMRQGKLQDALDTYRRALNLL